MKDEEHVRPARSGKNIIRKYKHLRRECMKWHTAYATYKKGQEYSFAAYMAQFYEFYVGGVRYKPGTEEEDWSRLATISYAKQFGVKLVKGGEYKFPYKHCMDCFLKPKYIRYLEAKDEIDPKHAEQGECLAIYKYLYSSMLIDLRKL